MHKISIGTRFKGHCNEKVESRQQQGGLFKITNLTINEKMVRLTNVQAFDREHLFWKQGTYVCFCAKKQ